MLTKKKKKTKKTTKPKKNKAQDKVELAIAKIQELSQEAEEFFHSMNTEEQKDGRD